jgi:hypothetical protein
MSVFQKEEEEIILISIRRDEMNGKVALKVSRRRKSKH